MSDYTTLEEDRRGVYRGCCPIHKGTNATSFVILDDKFAFCHSCGFSGTAINFYCEAEGLSYYQAVEALAEKYNINLQSNQQYQQQKSIVQRNAQTLVRFQKNIDVVKRHLIEKRKFTAEAIEEFQLGYSTDPQFLSSTKNPNTVFKGIIFPIHDVYGRPVGFSKRRTDGNTKPTYVNSYDDDVFDKSNTLYNLNRARRRLKDTKKLHIVEGYCDAISGHIQGLACVGYIGGYLVKGQIELLKEISRVMPYVEFVFSPDNPAIDETGAREMIRIREKLMKYAPELIGKSRFVVHSKEEFEFNGKMRQCKDYNDYLKQGIDLSSLQTQGIDRAVLELELNQCDNLEKEYAVVEKFVRSISNVMILMDIAKMLAIRWDQELSDVKEFLKVSGDTKVDEVLSEFSTAKDCIDKLLTTLDTKTYGIGFPKIDFSFGGVQKKEVVLIGAYSKVGKCVHEDSLISTNVGHKKIKDLSICDKLVTFNEQSNLLEYGNVEQLVYSGEKDGYKVRTRTGKSVVVSIDHPFLTPNGWIKIKDGLKIKDTIAIPAFLPYESADVIPIEEVELLALMIADGYCNSTLHYSKSDKYMVELMDNVCHFYGTELLHDSGCNWSIKNAKLGKITEKLKEHGLYGKRSWEKLVPQKVFRLTKELQQRFIEVIFSGDGWATDKEIGYSSASEQLVFDLSTLLMRFGIKSYVRTKKPKYTYKGETKEGRLSYNLAIRGKYLDMFLENFTLSPAKHTPIPKVRKSPNYEYKHKNTNDLIFEEIMSIEPIGKVKMYDISVSNGHNFVANNILVHNTDFLCEIILHSVMRLKMNCVVVSLEMPKEGLMRRLLVKLFGVNIKKLKELLQSPESAAHIAKALEVFDKYLYVIDTNKLSLDEIKYRVEIANKKIFDKPVDRVFVDYFQYMKNTEEFSDIEATAKSMKSFVKELNVELYMLSQFSRNDRSWERPSIASFKGGNSMESSFDKCILLWRPSKNPKMAELERDKIKYQTMVYLESREEMYGSDIFEMRYDPETSRLLEA